MINDDNDDIDDNDDNDVNNELIYLEPSAYDLLYKQKNT